MARACCETGSESAPKPKEKGARLVAYIAGNPNAGKTTLFNLLTGARQRTGNWPGVTVERREGVYRDERGEILFIDLPGVYSLSPGSGQGGMDESIARAAIANEPHDVIVNIVDASNLERNLYLTTQLIETRQPLVVALNMMDVAEAEGRPVDAGKLQEMLGVPVVPLVARKGKGVQALVKAVREAAAKHAVPTVQPAYSAAIAALLAELEEKLRPIAAERGMDAHWLAIRLVEGDEQARVLLPDDLRALLDDRLAQVRDATGEDPELLLAEGRYALAHDLATAALPPKPAADTATGKPRLSDRVDRLVLHPVAGPFVFLLAMYVLFMLSINVGGAFVDFFDILAGALFVEAPRALLERIGAPEWLTAVLADGIGVGIQTVATFIPIIGFLFLALTFLEDTGYMARAAFLADRLMRGIGLPGKAFVPLIVGFGCNVPAVMAARTLENPRDRIATILMTPFMSCGARLTVFALFAAAFFGAGGQNVVFLLYLVGILAAVLTGLLVKRTLLAGPSLPFIMELPPYRLPNVKSLLLHTWLRLKGFIFGAGKIIVVVVAVLGLLNSWGTDGTFGHQDSEKSVLSAIGKEITPVFSPLGIREENWPATVGLFTGVFAKEVVVGTLNALYTEVAKQESTAGQAAQTEEEVFNLLARVKEAFATIPANLASLRDLLTDPLGIAANTGSAEEVAAAQGVEAAVFGAMHQRFDGRVGAFAYMLFVLLYFPCLATFGAIAREIGFRWAAFSGLWSLWMAWFGSVSFYQAATLGQHPALSVFWLVVNAVCMLLVIRLVRWLGEHDVLTPGPRPAPAGE